jgi:hypothetical protein
VKCPAGEQREFVMETRTYHPSREFEKQLGDLAKLAQDKEWSFLHDAIAQLIADAEAQRVERIAHEAARTVFIAQHETFGLAQLARYKRFVSLLRALRAMFRDDKVVTAELDRFNRANSGKPRKAQPEAA